VVAIYLRRVCPESSFYGEPIFLGQWNAMGPCRCLSSTVSAVPAFTGSRLLTVIVVIRGYVVDSPNSGSL
jgi:hypothetical protein